MIMHGEMERTVEEMDVIFLRYYRRIHLKRFKKSIRLLDQDNRRHILHSNRASPEFEWCCAILFDVLIDDDEDDENMLITMLLMIKMNIKFLTSGRA